MSATGMKGPVYGWAIAGQFGLYTGWWHTRAAAIAQHCFDTRTHILLPASPDIDGRKLSTGQRTAWAHRKSVGDRAVRIVIRLDGRER